jgi:hypothetical protein
MPQNSQWVKYMISKAATRPKTHMLELEVVLRGRLGRLGLGLKLEEECVEREHVQKANYSCTDGPGQSEAAVKMAFLNSDMVHELIAEGRSLHAGTSCPVCRGRTANISAGSGDPRDLDNLTAELD